MCRPREHNDEGLWDRNNRDNDSGDEDDEDIDNDYLNEYYERLRVLHEEMGRVQEDIKRVQEECRLLRKHCEEGESISDVAPTRCTLHFQTAEVLLLAAMTVLLLTTYLWMVSFVLVSLQQFFTC